jgi:hypothetical protein
MSTRLQEILNKEGISKASLGRANGLNSTTIHYLCKDPKYYKRTRELTRHNVINAIEELGRNKKKYRMSELFPEKQ